MARQKRITINKMLHGPQVTLDQIGSHQYFVKQRVEDIDKRIQYMEVRGWEGERGGGGEGAR